MRMGLMARVQSLLSKASQQQVNQEAQILVGTLLSWVSYQAADLVSGVERLTDVSAMGTEYKVIAITSTEEASVVGFS